MVGWAGSDSNRQMSNSEMAFEMSAEFPLISERLRTRDYRLELQKALMHLRAELAGRPNTNRSPGQIWDISEKGSRGQGLPRPT